MLSPHFQETLAIKTDPVALAISHDVTNTHTVVSSVQNDALNTLAVVSDSGRNGSKRPEDKHDQIRAVSTIRTVRVVEQQLMPA